MARRRNLGKMGTGHKVLEIIRFSLNAQMVELADTLASGANARKGLGVRISLWAHNKSNNNNFN